jgi:hypothetical protein
VVERAHTGTIVSCVALKQSGREILVSQDDTREIKVWNVKDIGIPLIKTIGGSYNPVWYTQSLTELTLDNAAGEGGGVFNFLSACGSESKVIHYQIDL